LGKQRIGQNLLMGLIAAQFLRGLSEGLHQIVGIGTTGSVRLMAERLAS